MNLFKEQKKQIDYLEYIMKFNLFLNEDERDQIYIINIDQKHQNDLNKGEIKKLLDKIFKKKEYPYSLSTTASFKEEKKGEEWIIYDDYEKIKIKYKIRKVKDKLYIYDLNIIDKLNIDNKENLKKKINTIITTIRKLKEDKIKPIVQDFNSYLSATETKQKYKVFKFIQKKWDKEDELLNNRTAFFLIANGIFFAATRLEVSNILINVFFNIGIATIGIIISTFWRLVSYKTHTIISSYSQICDVTRPNLFEYISTRRKLWHKYYKNISKASPNRIIARWLPNTILVCWIAFIIFNIVLFFLKIYKVLS